MSHWYSNLGFNRNLLVQLSGGPQQYQLDVYVIARFRFFHTEDTPNWTVGEADSWKRRFANLVYHTRSEKWSLVSTPNCDSSEDNQAGASCPRARVRVHAVDVENPSVRLPSTQRIYAVNVYRQAPGAPRARQHADGLQSSGATVQDAGEFDLPSGTDTAELYEDSLELGRPSPVDGNQQVTAMHEFGHMLGLMHPNDTQPGCLQDRSAEICYGQAGSAESGGIMGRGQEVRREDYRLFPAIMSRLVREYLSPGFWGMSRQSRLGWRVEGTSGRWYGGHFEVAESVPGRSPQNVGSRRFAWAPGTIGTRGSRGNGRFPGPVGIG